MTIANMIRTSLLFSFLVLLTRYRTFSQTTRDSADRPSSDTTKPGADRLPVRNADIAHPKTDTGRLEAVQVSAAPRLIQVSKGKLIYNIGQSPAAAGGSVMDALQQMPGVRLDGNENLLIKGAAAGNVMIDGKRVYLSPQQLSHWLMSMPSDNIARIELITLPGAAYDAAGSTGIINIVTKKGSKPGYAATLSGALGVGHSLLNTENFAGNLKTEAFTIFGSFGYSDRTSWFKELNQQVISDNGQHLTYDRTITDPRYSKYYTYRAGIDLYLNKKQELGFVCSGSLDDWKKVASGPTIITNDNAEVNSILHSINVAKEPYVNNAFNLNYTYTIDSLGKTLTADADYLFYRNHSDGLLADSTTDPQGALLMPYQRLNFHQPSNIDIRSIKSDLTLPYRWGALKTGVKYSSVSIDNNFRYDSLIDGQEVFAPSLSDHFIYKEQISAIYLSVQKRWKSTDFEAGLRAEHTYSDGNSISTTTNTRKSYTNLFPALSIDYPTGKKDKLNLSLSSRINRPSYSDLNPVRYYYDQYSYYQGNTSLAPERSWIVAATYTLQEKYIFSFSYNRIDDFISKKLFLDTTTSAQVSRNVNFSHRDQYEAQAILPFIAAPFWNINLVQAVRYTTYPLQLTNGLQTVRRVTEDLRLTQIISFKNIGSIELVFSYTSPELYGSYIEKYYLSLDGGIKKTLLNQKLDVRLSFSDLFHTSHFWAYSIDPINFNSYDKSSDTRRVRLVVTYHLGGKLIGSKARMLEEKDRL